MSDKNPAPSGSKKYLLLSEVLRKNAGYIAENVLNSYCEYVAGLQKKTDRSSEDEAFISDFLSNIMKATHADAKVAEQVHMRATGSQELPAKTINTIKLNELVIKPEVFDGRKPAPQRWMDEYERSAEANGWSDSAKMKYMPTFLTRSAYDWFVTLAQPKLTPASTWSELKSWFMRHYLGESDRLVIKRQIQNTFQANEESVSSFMPRLLRLLLIVDPKMPELDKVDLIREKLRPPYHDQLCMKQPKTLEELNGFCLAIESGFMARKAAEARITKQPFSKFNERKDRSTATDAKKPTPPKSDLQSNFKNNRAPTSDRPSISDRSPTGKNDSKKCSRCNRSSHTVDQCRAKTKVDNGKFVPLLVNQVNPTSNASFAAAVASPPKVTTLNQVATVMSIQPSSATNTQLIIQNVKLNEVAVKALIDTGSFYSIISEDLLLQNNWHLNHDKPSLIGADSQTLPCLGTTTLSLSIAIGRRVKQIDAKFVVLRKLCTSVLIGLEILGWLKVTVIPSTKSLKFEDKPLKGLRLSENEILPARSQKVVKARAETTGTIQTLPFNFCPAVLVANSIAEVKDNTTCCLIVNLEHRDVSLPAGTQIASYQPLDHLTNNFVGTTIELGTSEEYVTIGDHLTPQQIKELGDILNDHQDAFSIKGSIGLTSVLKHKIELTEGAKPFTEPLRRRPLLHKEETNRQVKQMLADGILEHSESPWASAYVLAKKKGGDLRLCIDFRRLNDMTKKCAYPLPLIEDCIDTLAGKKFFTQLDLASGFWQIPLENSSKELTAFRTEAGHFQFTRMPFGLCNAPASFQRMVNAVFGGLTGLSLQIFIDDLCLATETWPEHLDLLKKVLELLIQSNLKLKSSKCLFGASKVIFLGHELSEQGVRQDPAKLRALDKLPIPTSASEVKRVVGLFSYYRKFVPNFAAIAEPLTRLTRKSQIFIWSSEQQNAFTTIIKELKHNATLAHFNNVDPVVIKTDASKAGIAGLLLQKQNMEWRLICCTSRRLNSSEDNYGITDLEGLAVVYAITKFRHYLLGRKFQVLTDHCALCALRKNLPNSARLRRWAIILSEFDFDIIYVKGGLHRDVDCLSRAPVHDSDDSFIDDRIFVVVSAKTCSAHNIAIPVDKEEWLSLSKEDREAQPYWRFAAVDEKGFKTINDLLYFDFKLYIPQAKREFILKQAHEESPACHGGVNATTARLNNVWWPSMQENIKSFVNSCANCQLRKAPRQLPSGDMYSHVVYEPLEMVAVDCLGPLSETLNHKRHIMVAIDVFTRFAYAKAVKDIQGTTFNKFLLELISRFGVPKKLLTDNSLTFCNALTTILSEKLHFKHEKSTPHHSQGNAVVERLIQSLQEKLALIVNADDSPIQDDWESALPIAILTINTSYHKSCGYTPFQLMFGSRAATQSTLLMPRNDPEDTFIDLLDQQLSTSRANTIALQVQAQTKSKRYFDDKHQRLSFDIGDLVLSRTQKRRAKLTNRYDGPYRVIFKERDIYKIESVDQSTHIVLTRHVSHLKPYIARNLTHDPTDSQPTSAMIRVCLIVITGFNLIASFSDAMLPLERVQPIVWKQSKKYVSRGLTEFLMEVRYANPCGCLQQWTYNPNEVVTAINQCNQLYEREINGKISTINYKPKKTAFLPTQSQIAKSITMAQQGSSQQPIKDNRVNPPRINRQTNATLLSADIDSTNNIRVTKTVNFRRKRGMMSFVTGAFASNIIETVLDRWFPNPFQADLARQQHYLEERADRMANSLNLTEIVIQASAQAVEMNAMAIHHNFERIDAIAQLHPQLMVATSLIVFKIQMISSMLERLRISFAHRRPDLITLAQLLDTDLLDNVDLDSILHNQVEIMSPSPGCARFSFVARNKSPDAMVYEVASFRFWSEVENTFAAKLLEYDGPRFLVFNSTNNCVKAISGQPQNDFVTVFCTEQDYEDQQLSKWKVVAVGDPYAQPSQVQIIESWPEVLISCYTLNITLRQQTEECPPHAFKLNATEKWATSDGYVYSPSAIEVMAAVKLEPVLAVLNDVHLRNVSHIVDENVVIKKLRQTLQALEVAKQKSIALNIPNGPSITYAQTSATLSIIITTGLFTSILGCYFWTKRANRRHHAIMRNVTDTARGSGVYDYIRSSRKSTAVEVLPPIPLENVN